MAILCTLKSGARAALVSWAGRKRKADSSDLEDTVVVKKYRNPTAAGKKDRQWLARVMKEFEALQYAKTSDLYEKIERAKEYLSSFESPTHQDQYVFSSAEDARRLLIEQDALDVPVFVQNGTDTCTIDPEKHNRPIEQVFAYFTNDQEWFEHHGQSHMDADESPTWTLQQITNRFRQHNGYVEFPLNFPDIATPFINKAQPAFVQSSSCTLLHDLLRGVLNVNEKDVGAEPPKQRNRPYLTNDEMLTLTQAWQLWQGTTMLSEAGTITTAHFDEYSMPTWISCAEGEIGFAWLSHPTSNQRVQWKLKPAAKPTGRWVFRVLRPGDALYMPSGTVHFVLRRPRGKQTLGFAGHVLRNQDLKRWLATLSIELSAETQLKDDDRAPYDLVLPPLLREVRVLIAAVRSAGHEARFGGEHKLAEALSLVGKVEEQVHVLQKIDSR